MDKVRIKGGNRLVGEIKISGAKNAALPLMAASILTEGELKLINVPHLADISTMVNLLIEHGVDFSLDGCSDKSGHTGGVASLKAANITNFTADYEIVRKMRASFLVMGPLLARFGKGRVSLPGGCAIGTRPIDLHLSAFEKMGVSVSIEDGYVNASVNGRLKGAEINFDKVSVGATENIVMAATLAEGQTVINNAAMEPEVTDLVNCLNAMGADIKGVGTERLVINGVKELSSAEYSVIADRIEAGTYMVAAAITKGDLLLRGIKTDIMQSVIHVLEKTGSEIYPEGDGVRIINNNEIKPIDIVTEPYPGFPTDMQAQVMALVTMANGVSTINETIFENRFMHVSELMRMGADIKLNGTIATIHGIPELKGAQVMATDLRASVSLVIAALAAKGETVINRMYHIDRGYERIEEKLSSCGAEIERIK